ncbi:MAG: sensor histidine kinase [Selenomonadaceae bacterium]
MENLHRLLRRQMEEHLSNITLTPELKSFIWSVHQAYINQDKDRLLLERSIEISSREYNENMEKIRLLQSQLIQQEKMAGIGQLSAGIAHEINNPLGYTQSNLDTLKKYVNKIKDFLEVINSIEKMVKSDSDNEVLEIMEIIKATKKKNKISLIIEDLDDIILESIAGLERIEKIVKSLLGFSRTSVFEFEEYDLNKGILDTLAVANNEIKYVAEVMKDFGDIPYIKAAGGAVNQVLLNLIINAVHAIQAASRKGRIVIKTFKKNGAVYCSIQDNGIGIKKENLNSIFMPFFTTKEVGKGTGLGLSIAYDIIVNKHEGKINIETEEGVGTTFIIRLPLQHKTEYLI